MPAELRKSGISVVGDLTWGTHFCHFYETKQDLLDILLPYFKTGLENNEFCLWIAADPLNVEEATTALQQAVPQADRYFAAGAIEILPHNTWYLPDGDFHIREVLDHWLEKANEMLEKGFDGLRANGNETWLTKKDWDDFCEYEKVLNELMTDQRMIVVCTYPLAKSRGGEIFDVTQTHQFAIAKRHGIWEIVESPALHQTKAELKRLNDELEQRIAKRTTELAATNEKLRSEITERKQIEEHLREEKYLTEQIINSLPGVFYVLDEKGRFRRWNKNFERVTGYTHEEFPQLNPLDLFVGPDQKKIEHCLEDVFTEGRSIAEVELRAKDGSRTPYYFTGRRVPFGEKNYDFGMGIDITDRKRTEESLRESEERFAKAFRSSPAINVIMRLDDGRYLDVNDAFTQVYGYERDEAIGRTSLELGLYVNPLDRAVLLNRLRAGQSVHNYESQVRTKEGRILDVLIFAEYIELASEPCILGSVYDISERKRAEEKLKETSEQLRALLESLRLAREEEGIRIARELHDDLGSALTGLKMDLSWLGRRLPPEVDKAVWQKLDAMADFIDKTMQQVRNIAHELRPSELDDLGLVAAIKWQAKEFQERTEIKCRVTARDEEINLSPEQSIAVFRILQEILTNVMRHAQATTVQINLKKQARNFILKVSDNGRGISESDLRAPGSLGLLGMRERVAVFGGKIDISGIAGKGTTVTVSIPLD